MRHGLRGMLQGSALLTPVGRALAGEGGAAGRGGACAGSGGANSSSGGASSSGSASCEGQPLSELVCVVDSLPHEWVLPRCAWARPAGMRQGSAPPLGSSSVAALEEEQCARARFCIMRTLRGLSRGRCSGAVHHGGIGHVLSCLAAGIPMLVAP